ncbi:MAG: diaminopimelate decarboxylase [Actinomycetota bacterium]|nr:diaminopimelate decarboxylase [Actinomycetota bacterium]MDH4352878.1 diaminopimelate decarboxylase [Actinomycetota bacterium]MDH5278320.1 diaminopimelate decarboxylase [Actinomycetota bacterium]
MSDRPAVLELFPDGTRLADDGGLVVGGCRLTDVAGEFGTPTFCVDEAALRRQARRFADGLESRRPGSHVAFASKSFPCTAVYRLMAEEGLAIDVAGAGELVMALAAGVDPATIVLHGNAKTDDELRRAVVAGVGTIVVDGFDDIRRLDAMLTRRQNVLLRVIPGVDARTQAAISTGHLGSKFGLSLADAGAAVERLRATEHLNLLGLHLHVGSQILQTGPFTEAIEAVAGLGTFAVYDVGGGLGVRYTYDEHPPTVEEYLDALTDAARSHLPDDAQLWIEPGRSLVAQSTVTLYRVVTVKAGTPVFVAVDGGIADNFEASTYMGQRFEATLVERVGGGSPVELVGRQCESGDLFASDVPLRDARPGDLLAVPMTGAYSHTLANNYNGALRPPVVFCSEGTARAVVRRDTYDDLLARDL